MGWDQRVLRSTTSARETPVSRFMGAAAVLLQLLGSRNFDPLTEGSPPRCGLSFEWDLLMDWKCCRVLLSKAEWVWLAGERRLGLLPGSVAIC